MKDGTSQKLFYYLYHTILQHIQHPKFYFPIQYIKIIYLPNKIFNPKSNTSLNLNLTTVNKPNTTNLQTQPPHHLPTIYNNTTTTCHHHHQQHNHHPNPPPHHCCTTQINPRNHYKPISKSLKSTQQIPNITHCHHHQSKHNTTHCHQAKHLPH